MTIAEQRATMHRELEEMIAYYSEDVNRRAVADPLFEGSSPCFYRTEDGRMCAVGRKMLPEWISLLAGDGHTVGPLLGDYPDCMGVLGIEINTDFWRNVQRLHDRNDNWTSEGISERGMDRAREIHEAIDGGEYDLGPEQAETE